MPKVIGPLLSQDARGRFGHRMIFRRGGIVVNYFKPRNPNSAAQQAQREAFRSLYVPGLTQEQADLLYAAIVHLHDDRYSQLGHEHDDLYSLLSHLHDDRYAQLSASDPFTQYLNQTRGDARYVKLGEIDRVFLNWALRTVSYPLTATAVYCQTVVPADVIFKKWNQAFHVISPNNGSNYWKIKIMRLLDNVVVKEFNTASKSAGSWQLEQMTTFDNGTVVVADLGVYLYYEKIGSPGNIYPAMPTTEVEL